MPLRTIAFVFLVLFGGLYATITAQGVPQPTTQVDTDKVDAPAFAILFRRENAYLKAAKAAKSPESPETQLPKVIPNLFALDSTQASSVEHFAGAWEADVVPIRSQLTVAISAFHSSFPNGRLNPNVDPTPPAAIRALRAQIDAVTLRYRDQLRNDKQETAFQDFQAKLRKTFDPNVNARAGQQVTTGDKL